jgi:hypothetical protein
MAKCAERVGVNQLSRGKIMKKGGGKHKQAQSSVIRPGTGSGSRPGGSKVMIPTSEPKEMHGLGRKPNAKVLT